MPVKEITEFLKGLHLMDIVLFLTIVGFAFLGFSRGTMKLLIILGSLYFGFILGAIYYRPFAEGVIRNVFHFSLTKISEIVAFLLINSLVSILLIVLLYQFFGHIEVHGRVGACVDRPIGMLLGFAAGIMLTSIIVVLLEVPYELYSDLNLSGDQAPLLNIFHDWYQTSILGPVLTSLLPILLAASKPLLGGHDPPILVKPGSVSDLSLWIALLRSRFGI